MTSTPHPNLPNQNPNNEPTGDFTGRCGRCGSNDLWDDNLWYGCNNCGHVSGGPDVGVRLVRNRSDDPPVRPN